MKVGYSLVLDAASTPADVLAVVTHADSAGLDDLWVCDHLVTPVDWAYPNNDERRGASEVLARYRLEALTTLAFVASATARIGLGTSVVVLPQREPILFAKQAATIDMLSGARLRLGIGVGWSADEFALLGAAFQGRGAVTDASIEMCRALWTSDEPAVVDATGRDVHVDFAPRRPNGIPFLVGGVSRASVVRAARIGDGWMPGYADPDGALPDFRHRYAELCRLLDSTDRRRDEVPVVLKLQMQLDPSSPPRPDAVLGTIEAYAAAGVDEVILDVARPPSASFSLGLLDWIAAIVLPRCRV